MGSPHGPILADLFVTHLESSVNSLCNNEVFYRRYVDDIIVFADGSEQLSDLTSRLNSIHPNMRFSLEIEQSDQLPFLDILIERKSDGSVRRSVYHKNTWTGQYLNFNSFVPAKHKRGLVKTSFDRARKICSDGTLEQEFELIRRTLKLNGYPSAFIAKYSKATDRKEPVSEAPLKPVYIRLPFKGDDVSDLFEKRLSNAVSKAYNTAKPIILYTTRRIPCPPVKIQVPLIAQNNVIYHFMCRCESAYVGRTERHLHVRLGEHIPKWITKQMNQPHTDRSELIDTQTRQLPTSAIGKHLISSGHVIDIHTAVSVLFRSPNKRILRFAEAIAISRLKPALCVQKTLFVQLALPW